VSIQQGLSTGLSGNESLSPLCENRTARVLGFPKWDCSQTGLFWDELPNDRIPEIVPEFIQEQFGVVVGILMNFGNSGIVLGMRAPPHLVFPEQPHLSSLPSIKNQ
jgi:hypothetical protein